MRLLTEEHTLPDTKSSHNNNGLTKINWHLKNSTVDNTPKRNQQVNKLKLAVGGWSFLFANSHTNNSIESFRRVLYRFFFSLLVCTCFFLVWLPLKLHIVSSKIDPKHRSATVLFVQRSNFIYRLFNLTHWRHSFVTLTTITDLFVPFASLYFQVVRPIAAVIIFSRVRIHIIV